MRLLLFLSFALFLSACNPLETEGCGEEVPEPPSGFDGLAASTFVAEVKGDYDLDSDGLGGDARPFPDTLDAFRLIVMGDDAAHREIAVQALDLPEAQTGDVLEIRGYYEGANAQSSTGSGTLRITAATAKRIEGSFAFCADREGVTIPGLPPLPDPAVEVRGGFHVARPQP